MTGTLKTTLIQNPSSADVNITLGTSGEVTLAKSPVLNGSTSGTLTIAAPAVAGTNTQTLVAATGTLAPLISGTAVASTSGTSITFTSIPSYVKRIIVMFSSVSTNGTSGYKIRIGPSGGVETSGYLGICNSESGSSATNPTTSFLITPSTELSAASVIQGRAELLNFSGNTWVCVSQVGRSDAAGTGAQLYASGTKPLAGVLTQIEISTSNGTDTFDAGSINIMYE